MSLVNVINMAVLENPAPFQQPLQFEITFECLQQLEDDLEWKVLYVGSAESSKHDQVLDEILVGPVPVGVNKFVLQADAPDTSTIPSNDLLGVTVLLITCSYKEQEFARVGYYVNNEYMEPYDVEQGPPQPLLVEKVRRTILADKPRVTRFPINWGCKGESNGQNVQEAEGEAAAMDQDEEFALDLQTEEQDDEQNEEEDDDDESMDDELDIDLEDDAMDNTPTSAGAAPQQSLSPERKEVSYPQSALVTPVKMTM